MDIAAADRVALAKKDGRLGALADLIVWLVITVLASLAVGLLARERVGGEFLIRLAVPAQMIILFVLATVLLRRRGERWRSVGLAWPGSWRRVAGLVIAGYLGVICLNGLLVLLVFPRLGVAPPVFGALGVLKGHPELYVSWLLLAWSSAALGEELQFRGFLWSRLERLFGGGRAAAGATLIVQAGLFGLGHVYQGLGGVLATACAGLVLGAVFLAGRRNLVACMVLHGLIDTVSLTALFLGLVPTPVAS
jgi:membrane protease YdiL (CAAX protease family)